MKKLLLIAILVAIVAGGVYQYMRMNTYSYHLDKAETALVKIDDIIKGGNTPITFIPTLYADGGGVDEAAIARNAETAANEIGEAQYIVNDMSDSASRTAAQGEVNETTEHAKKTFKKATQVVEGEGAKNTINNAQDSLDDIGTDSQNKNKNHPNADIGEKNPEDGMAASQEGEPEETQIHGDSENENVDMGRGAIQGEDDDDFGGGPLEDDDGEDDEDFDPEDASVEDGKARYKPLLEWDGKSPLPKEGDKDVLSDSAEIVGSENVADAMREETSEALKDQPFSAEDMQEAINKMMQQQ